MNLQTTAELLWADFKLNFRQFLAATPQEAFINAWARHANRTLFYRAFALDQVAKTMGYDVRSELYTVDFVMRKRVDSASVPYVFIESENAAFTAGHEISKLCCIAAPLRVLITVVEWDETKGVWSSGGHRSRLLNEWASIIRIYNSVWPRPGVIGVIVGEWRHDNVLRFYTTHFDPEGSYPDDEIILERNIVKPRTPSADTGMERAS